MLVLSHDDVADHFRNALRQGRLASSFLFVGPPGVGKRSFALHLAQALLCTQRPAVELNPCGACASCVQVVAGTHPDVILVARPAEKAQIPVDLLIGDREHRMQEGLCHDLSLRPMMGGRKIAIIDDADYLNEEGANCLLKTLEEPPPGSVLILIGTSPARQLPTIRSRCQLVRFHPLPTATVECLLAQRELVPPADVARLAALSEGSLQRAGELSDPGLWSMRGQLLAALAGGLPDFPGVSKALAAFVEEAGREAAPRRQRLRQTLGFAVEFYRALLRSREGQAPLGDAELQAAVQRMLSSGVLDIEGIADRLDICLETLTQIDRNLNQSTLIEAWLDRLAG